MGNVRICHNHIIAADYGFAVCFCPGIDRHIFPDNISIANLQVTCLRLIFKVLGDTGWITSADDFLTEDLIQRLEELVVAAALVALPKREIVWRLRPEKKKSSGKKG